MTSSGRARRQKNYQPCLRTIQSSFEDSLQCEEDFLEILYTASKKSATATMDPRVAESKKRRCGQWKVSSPQCPWGSKELGTTAYHLIRLPHFLIHSRSPPHSQVAGINSSVRNDLFISLSDKNFGMMSDESLSFGSTFKIVPPSRINFVFRT